MALCLCQHLATLPSILYPAQTTSMPAALIPVPVISWSPHIRPQRQQAWRGSQGSSYTTMLFCHVWYVTPDCLSCGVGSSSCSVTTGLFNLHSGYRQSQDQSSDDVGLCFCFRNVLGSISQTFNCWNRLPKEGNCISQSSLEEQNL